MKSEILDALTVIRYAEFLWYSRGIFLKSQYVVIQVPLQVMFQGWYRALLEVLSNILGAITSTKKLIVACFVLSITF